MLKIRDQRAALAIVEAETRKVTASTADQVKVIVKTILLRVTSVSQRVEVYYRDQTSSEVRVHICGPDLFGGFTVRLAFRHSHKLH